MLKYLFLLLTFIVSLSPTTIIFANINLQGQMPRATFSEKRHDFGTMYQGQIFAHQFPFENTGNGTLLLTSLHASCGCINARTLDEDGVTAKNIFRPGEKGVVAVDFDSGQFAGEVARTIIVETNSDLGAPTITLTLTANIKQEISTTPAMLYLGQIQKNDDKEFDVQIDLHNKDLKLLKIESDLPFVTATLNHENNLNVKIHTSNTLPIGPFQGNITILNTSEYYKNFKIPIIGEVAGHVQISTKFLEFGVVNKNQFSDRAISFKSKNNNFTITGVKIDLNNSVNFKRLAQKDIFDIQKNQQKLQKNGDVLNEYIVKFKLKYPSKMDAKLNLGRNSSVAGLNVSGSFLIETNDPDYAQIKVPFFGVFKQE